MVQTDQNKAKFDSTCCVRKCFVFPQAAILFFSVNSCYLKYGKYWNFAWCQGDIPNKLSFSLFFFFQNGRYKSTLLESCLEILKINPTWPIWCLSASNVPTTVIKKVMPYLVKLEFKRLRFRYWKMLKHKI